MQLRQVRDGPHQVAHGQTQNQGRPPDGLVLFGCKVPGQNTEGNRDRKNKKHSVAGVSMEISTGSYKTYPDMMKM